VEEKTGILVGRFEEGRAEIVLLRALDDLRMPAPTAGNGGGKRCGRPEIRSKFSGFEKHRK
jgi:hypothetical protein